MSPIFLQATTTTTILLISLLFLFTPTTTAADTVLDSKNNPVEAGSYYVGISLAFDQMGPYIGGAITTFNNGSLDCPSFIVSTSNINNNEYIPIKFSPQDSTEENTVYTSSNLNIAFEFLFPEPLCRRRYTTVWTESGNSVVLDGEEGSNGNWFKLEKVDYLADNYYSIYYGEKEVLYDEQPNGEILLSLEKGYPFIVTFLKYDESESTTLSDSLEMLHLQGLIAKKYSSAE